MASEGELWECALVTLIKTGQEGAVMSADQAVVESIVRGRFLCGCQRCHQPWIFVPESSPFEGKLVWPCQVELRNIVDQLGKLA